MFELSDHSPGKIRSAEEVVIIHACQEVFIAFCDLMDAGEVERAVALHTDDLVFYDAGRKDATIGRQPLLDRLMKVRFSYPGRRTLHTPSNFRFHKVNAQEAECRVVISLFDLVENPEGRGIKRYSTELLGYAAEECRFVPEGDLWRFQTRKVRFLAGAPQLPLGTLPGDLPWNE